jgi:hypothetical protein
MNKKRQAFLFILVGIIIICSGLYVYFVAHSLFPNSESSRVRDFNWLLKTFGKTGTAILFCLIGIILVYTGFRKLRK